MAKSDTMWRRVANRGNYRIPVSCDSRSGIAVVILLMALSFQVAGRVVPVDLVNIDGQFLLYRGGKPYFIKGGGGKKFLDRLAAYGGNSVRTWGSDNAREVLDQAHSLGLTVTLGLWIQHERHGFDYDDPVAVNLQLEKFRDVILEYKDHPALLMWGIGNEVNLQSRNFKVWETVQEVARMVHELDGNHPTMTVLAGSPRRDIRQVMEKCPDIEILGANVYAGLLNAPEEIRNAGWGGPYVVTEWGNDGYWEVGSTGWGASLEQNSTEKAEAYLNRYQEVIVRDSERNLGSYVFLWGNTDEKTPTWFGMFTARGEETPAVDVMRYLWTGTWPGNLAPSVSAVNLEGIDGKLQNLYLDPAESYSASVNVSDPDGDEIYIRWELLPDGGPDRTRIPELQTVQESVDYVPGVIRFSAPKVPGGYRLYVYAFDGHNHVATANLPVFVKDHSQLAEGTPATSVPAG